MSTVTVKRLTCAETAKLVRKELKKHFPGQKFSVRSHTYAGGASISIGSIVGHELDGSERVGVYCDEDGNFTPLTGSTEWVQDLVYRASVARAA